MMNKPSRSSQDPRPYPKQDRHMAVSPEPQKLFNQLPPTPKQNPQMINQLQIAERTPPKTVEVNPESPEKEIAQIMQTPNFITFLPWEIFEKKFELAIKNKQNKGNLPSRKIDIYLKKDSQSQNDFYAVKNIDCTENISSLGKKIQSLMIYNYLLGNEVCVNVAFYTVGWTEKKSVSKKKSDQILNFSLVMELAETNLADEISIRKNKKNPFTKFELYSLCETLVALVSKIEKKKIAHGNLKPENFLLVGGKYKLSDFNGSIYEKPNILTPEHQQITTKYIPKELNEKIQENQEIEINFYKLDVFSLAAIFLECIDLIDSVDIDYSEEIIQEKLNKITGKFDSWFIDMLKKMLDINEETRIDISQVSEIMTKHHEEIHKLQFEKKTGKTNVNKKEITIKPSLYSSSNQKNVSKKFEKPKLKNETIPRAVPNRSKTPESPIKEQDPESRYSSLERKKNKEEITHLKVTSYVSPRAEKGSNKFKFPIKNEKNEKNEIKKPNTAKVVKNIDKNNEENDTQKDLYKDFIEKLNKMTSKSTNFPMVLSHFTLAHLSYDKNIFYQKYITAQESKNLTKKIVTENKRKDGKIVRFYSDHSQEILFNNGARKIIFPDSYSIIYFLNNDIKQTFPYEMTIYYYADSQTTQITYEKFGINIYHFKNEQLELHHADGRIEIRLSDGTEKHLMVTNTK